MFTGIVEEIGRVERVTKGAKSSKLLIKADTVLEGTRIGDSICTSGVCLTVTRLEEDCFEADVMAETMRRSKLGQLTAGSPVNLERALPLGGRFGGHMVSGHIDGTGTIRSVTAEDNAVWLNIAANEKLLRYIVEKGSIAVDGISLTVASVDRMGFMISLIPHTGKETALLRQKTGDTVNLECDIIGKYVEKLLGRNEERTEPGESRGPGESTGLSEELLKENGFY